MYLAKEGAATSSPQPIDLKNRHMKYSMKKHCLRHDLQSKSQFFCCPKKKVSIFFKQSQIHMVAADMHENSEILTSKTKKQFLNLNSKGKQTKNKFRVNQ